ncbi:hypothetical protein HPB50_024134 [Hyalomma asiaticum]|uniref:Uncharacterized protein n=1 Tax=Hyalomma asiaticum TaxID=266040 RepID=A0ACB7TMJ9_HYAAI|nr:hypothetical protein HPB50_024134 [Hyalomma asiaticum]
MASEDANAPKCDLEGDGCVRLSSILQAFGAPIREEQAWAVCYQTSKCMCKEWTADNRGCYCLTDTSQLRIHKDGSVHSSTVRDLGPAVQSPAARGSRPLVVRSVGWQTREALAVLSLVAIRDQGVAAQGNARE